VIRPGIIRGAATSASTFLLAMLIIAIGGGAALGSNGIDGSAAATAVSYLNPLLTAFLAGIAGVWQAARADVASKRDALIAGVVPPCVVAVLLMLPGAGDWSVIESVAALLMVVVGGAAGGALMARRLRYVAVD
jgi:hypothetical protein